MSRVRLLSCTLLALALIPACSGDKKAEGDEKAAGDKGDKAEADAGDKAEADAGDKAEGEAAETGEAKAELHFDVSKDKSGVLARTAGVLETREPIHSENLAEISHHAEKLVSDEELCEHVAEVRGTDAEDLDACIKTVEHHFVLIGPEIYAEYVTCVMDAKTPEALDVCEAAEKEAEIILHEKPHGEGLEQKTCDDLFVHFEKLAMEDAGEQAEVVKEILEETRVDVVAACVDQGTKAEVECAMKAKTMAEIKDCASKLL